MITRRELLNGGTAALAGKLSASPALAQGVSSPKLRAIAFDAFAVFDPRPVFVQVEQMFPEKAAALSAAWRTRQFEYTWLRVLSGTYADFWQVTEDALVFASRMLGLDITAEQRGRLMEAYLQLGPWPEAPSALGALKGAGVELAFLSNFTGRMLDAAIRNSAAEGMFEHVLSTDAVKTYKPDPRAYRMAVDAFRVKREEILFVAFAGWDAAGAKSFGYPTFWVNRLKLPSEELSVVADASGETLVDLVSYVRSRS